MTTVGAQDVRENPKPRIQTAVRTVDLLQAVARASSSGISARDLSEELSLRRQVIYHLIHTLVSTNMLRQVGGKKYVLGLNVGSIAHGYMRQSSAPDYLKRYAELAAALTGETAYVVGWVETEIVVLAAARGNSAIHAAEPSPGTAGDAHARASGKLLLAMSSDEEALAYLARSPLTARTENTLTESNAISEELTRIRKDWVAKEREEYAEGLACMAVPIGRPPSRLALGISAPVERFDRFGTIYAKELHQVANS